MLLAILGLLSVAVPAPPDIVPEGVKPLQIELRLEMATAIRGVCVAWRVAEGDTLATIAASQLGDRERAGEIAALNPGVEDGALEPGRELWLPPRNPARPGELLRLCYIDPMAPISSYPRPFTVNALQVRAPRGRLSLVLVPVTERSAFERARGLRRAEFAEYLAGKPGIVRVECGAPFAYVALDDPRVRRIDTYRLTADPDTGTLAVELASSDAFDRDGEPVATEVVREVEEGRKKQAFWFVLVACGGALGLLSRRRRPRLILQTA